VDLPGLEANEALAAPEGVRRTRHRLDREAATGDVRQRIAGEDHQVRMALVDPERRDLPNADAGASVIVPHEVGEAVVELDSADRLRLPEVELCSLDRVSADRDRALVGGERRLGGNAELEVVHEAAAGRQVGVSADPVRARFQADVGRR
jgi:hypothetical protein